MKYRFSQRHTDDTINRLFKEIEDNFPSTDKNGTVKIKGDLHCSSIYIDGDSLYIGGVKITAPTTMDKNANNVYLKYNKDKNKFDYEDTPTDLTTHAADTTTHGTTGAIVGISDAQTLTNKKFGGASHYSEFEADGTLAMTGDATVWDDMRVVPGSFDRPGVTDPTIIAYDVNGGGVSTYLWQFQKNAIASFSIQVPHNYKSGSNIYVHIHWTPGPNGSAENGATVGWKIDYSWANINGNFGTMLTADLSDACDGTNHKHQMTPDVSITGTDKGISSMLICNVKRTDTGTDDTWAGTASGSLPLLLEIDFHYEIDTVGSRQRTAK